MESKSKVAEMIQKIDSDFHLVLLVEQMEESLILLKELLCWDLIDIRYFKLNERSEETKKSQMTSNTRARLKKWLWADYELYEHFQKKLNQLIQDFGVIKMKNQVNSLQDLNNELRKNCHMLEHEDNSDLKGTGFYMASDSVKGLSLDQNCSLFAISEPYFFRLIRYKQRKLFGVQSNQSHFNVQFIEVQSGLQF